LGPAAGDVRAGIPANRPLLTALSGGARSRDHERHVVDTVRKVGLFTALNTSRMVCPLYEVKSIGAGWKYVPFVLRDFVGSRLLRVSRVPTSAPEELCTSTVSLSRAAEPVSVVTMSRTG
jgi:hypothetical protein